MKLRGRCAIITGASEGLGAAIAERYVAEGASVLLCARRVEALEAVRSRLSAALDDEQQVLAKTADVARPEEIDALVEYALSAWPRLDILVNNAGVYGPIGSIETVAWQDWVDAVQINLLGTVYACRAVLPHFRSRGYGKIINLSGGGATAPLPRLSAYAAAKAAVVRFTETLAEECAGTGIDVNAVAPGALATRLTEELVAAGPERAGADLHSRMSKVMAEGGTPLDRGAELCVFLGSAESDGISGRLISAVWDPWPELPAHRDAIAASDIYTLRRILPKDRGEQWGEV